MWQIAELLFADIILFALSNATKRCAYDVTSQVLREDRSQNNRRLLQCRPSNGGQIFVGFSLAISRLFSLLSFQNFNALYYFEHIDLIDVEKIRKENQIFSS